MDLKVLLDTVAPAAGVVTAILLFFSPLGAAREALKDGSLGDLNAIPFPLVAANCGGWVSYAIVVNDPYVFLANAPGVIVGLYMMMVALRLADAQTANRITALVLVSALLLEVVGFLGAEGLLLHHNLKLLWRVPSALGFAANGILLVFYASPLSSLLRVFQTQSNAAIHLNMAIMTILNGALWVAYGLAIRNPFIWVPNSMGAILGVVQVVLWLWFWYVSKPSELEEPLMTQYTEEAF